MKINLLIAITISYLFFIACCSEDNKKTNLLVQNKITVNSSFFLNDSIMPHWQKGFSSKIFFKNLFSKVFTSDIKVYSPEYNDTSNSPMKNEDVMKSLKSNSTTFDVSSIKSIFFTENWFLDTSKAFIFTKEVENWCPVFHFYRDSIERRKLVCKLTGGNPSVLLASNVISECSVKDSLYPNFTKNINVERLAKIIIDYVLSGRIKAFSPADMNKELQKEEINKLVGKITDTISVVNPITGETQVSVSESEIPYDEMTSIIFVEDWYYDKTTFAIRKVITGLGLVRHYFKHDESTKSIVFMIYPDGKKTQIFI
jgi:hypothetical protein